MPAIQVFTDRQYLDFYTIKQKISSAIQSDTMIQYINKEKEASEKTANSLLWKNEAAALLVLGSSITAIMLRSLPGGCVALAATGLYQMYHLDKQIKAEDMKYKGLVSAHDLRESEIQLEHEKALKQTELPKLENYELIKKARNIESAKLNSGRINLSKYSFTRDN